MFNVRKSKRIAKFDGLEPRRYEDIEGIVAQEIGPKRFGTIEKQAPGQGSQLIDEKRVAMCDSFINCALRP